MSSNQPIASPEPLSVPHFNEEATLLSARPVVPLHEVRAETRSKRRLVFASAIVVALLVGGVGASLLFMPGDKETTRVVENGQGVGVDPGSDSSQHNEGALSDSAGQSSGGQSPAGQEIRSGMSDGVQVPNTEPRQSIKPAPRSLNANDDERQAPRASSAASPRRENSAPNSTDQTLPFPRNDAEDMEMTERRLRREERREARRLRRERRNTRDQSSDDLMRIREIFEGTPRP